MSRYSHYGEERDGYVAYENRRSRHESYPYEEEYSFRQGWKAAERDERYERDLRCEREEIYERYATKQRKQEREHEEDYPVYCEPSYEEQQIPEEEV